MTWTLCRKGATHRLSGAVVSFTRCGSSIIATTSEEVWEGLGQCAFFSVHQHDASVPVENKPTPAMRAAGREAIAAYVQAHAVHDEPVTADVVRTIGADHGLTAAEATRVMQAALSELAEARAAERRGKG